MTATATKTPKRSLAERKAANEAADERAQKVKEMTPAERKKIIAELQRDLAESAPPMEVVESDLLGVLLAVGAEFIRRYFPEANHANLYIAQRPEKGSPEWSVMIPMATAGKS